MLSKFKLFFLRYFFDIKRHLIVKVNGEYNPYPETPMNVNLSSYSSHYAHGVTASKALSISENGIENIDEWQKRARNKLANLMAYDESLIVIKEKYAEELSSINGINRVRHFIEGFDGNDIPVTLLWKNASNIHSVLICLAGSASGVHLLWGEAYFPADVTRISLNTDVAIQAAERGFLVVCVEQRCFGQREERQLKPRSAARCVDAFMHSLLIGRTLIGENVTDVSTVLSWLEKNNNPIRINDKQVWIYGHSTGGTHAVYASAIDTRIKGVIASGCISSISESLMKRRNPEGDAILPGFLKWFDFHDLICLCAPRPFIAVTGRNDHIFPYDEMLKVIKKSKVIYEKLNSFENIQVVTGDGGHRMYIEELWPVINQFFTKNFLSTK